jgi:hypothetical protein
LELEVVWVEESIPQIRELSSEVTVERGEEEVTIEFVASYQLCLQPVQLLSVSEERWERNIRLILLPLLMEGMAGLLLSTIPPVELLEEKVENESRPTP